MYSLASKENRTGVKEMLSLKIIQAELKKVKISLTQDVIAKILESQGLIATQLEDGELSKIVQMFQEENSKGAGLTVNGKKPKVTLALPNEFTEREEVNIEESDRNASRQQRDSQTLGDRLVETADLVSDRNLDMALALPQLVGTMTKQKLAANKAQIDDLWNQTNDELTDIMFNV